MASNLNKFLAVIAGVIGVIAIIPIDALAWWKVDVDPALGSVYSNFIDAFAQYHGRTGLDDTVTIVQLDSMFLISGISVIIGAVLLFAGGIKEMKAIAAIGAILTLAGPVVFLMAHSSNAFLAQSQYLDDQNLFFGTNSILIWDLTGSSNWYLGVGFYLPFIGGVLGLLSLKSNK
ncbi:MAG: hypothetical protein JW839_06515 [Candidatus Lokiarchaeota archaeon]|nr:hypothetical protein [Candidatus Lokiarchaeota archaeon]